jgi:GNAT superfamily N-acetyltransferase
MSTESSPRVIHEVTQGPVLEKVRGVLEAAAGEGGLGVRIGGTYYVILDPHEEPLAMVALKKRSWCLTEIRHLYVAPPMRGRGVARSLMRHALERVTTPLVCATTRANNMAVARLNQEFGFSEVERFTSNRRKIFFWLLRTCSARL